MYSTRIFYNLTLFAGIFILIVGCYMKVNDILSKGQPYKTRLGTYVKGEIIDGNGTIVLAVLLLIISFAAYKRYIFERKEIDRKRQAE